MKKRRFIPKSQDLIKLKDRKTDNNKNSQKAQQNQNIINNLIKIEEVKQNKIEDNKETIKQNININYKNNFNNNIIHNNRYNNVINVNESKNNPQNAYLNNIITILRIRPESDKEKEYSNIDIIKIENSTSMKLVSPTEYNSFIDGTKYLKDEKGLEVTATKEYNYKFNYIFAQNSQQNDIYQYSTSFLVSNIFEGFNSTIFAYGSTGSGKTYTMMGTETNPGIVLRSINQILNIMENNGINAQYDLQITYFEIYNENIYDLLSGEDKNNSKLRKMVENSPKMNKDNDLIKFNNKKNNNGLYNKFFLIGLTKKIINSQDEAFQIISEANKKRSIGITSQNNNSSRSHCVLQINIVNKTMNADNFENNLINDNLIEDKESTKYGKLILIDMAGNEKVAEIKPNTDNFYINKSLFTLSNCINGLINNKNSNYIPWRDSKLTRLLKDSLTGNSKVVMIANISPSLLVIDDTYNTLNFANKIKQLKVNVQKNTGNKAIRIDKFDSVIESLKAQIINVKNELKNQEDNSGIYNEDQIDGNISNEDNEKIWSDILQRYTQEISDHFKKEIDICKKINDIELKIMNINKQDKNKMNQNDIHNNASKLNDYQIEVTSLYGERFELIKQRRNIQIIINKETKKDTNNPDVMNMGKYLMYVYKYYINLINQLQEKNRRNRIENDIQRKDNQIKTLNEQIKLRDNLLNDIRQKSNIPNNFKNMVDLKELNIDPCNDIYSIRREKNINKFVNSVVNDGNIIQMMKRNISMPILRNKPNGLKGSNSTINNNSLIVDSPLPLIRKNNYFNNSQNNTNKFSSFGKRIPSGYLLRDNKRINNLKSNLIGEYKKYYNIYHISNNYHMQNFNVSNPYYKRNKNLSFGVKIKNQSSSSLNFENDYAKKVKTILNKNIISRYRNSPYSLDNI